jgi:TRAP transporter TAXI family solute receptor
MLRLMLAVLCAVAVSFPVYAEESFGLVTGPKTGTYYAIGKEIAQASAKSGIAVDVKSSEGSIDNIKRINSTEKAALGIVQSDVLGFLARSKNPDSMRMASNLRLVFPLYNEEVHVFARKDIAEFSDLSGKRVAIGEDGSGNMLTAINLFSMMGVNPAETLKIPPAQGVVSVLKGEIDAVLFVAGKPVRLFKNLEDLTLPENQKFAPMLANTHFLALDNPKMLEEYKPASITHADYNFVTDAVRTIAVQAVMISYDFSDTGTRKRCNALASLTKMLRAGLPALKEKGHPKWKEINLDADTGIWKKDVCAWPELAAKPGDPPQTLGKDLIEQIEKKQ